MKVLVFGGPEGQVATCLRQLEDARTEVQTLGRRDVDFCKPGQIAGAIAATDADVIINAAAYTSVDRAEQEPELAEQVNHHAVAEIGRAAAMRGIPVLHISTEYVFSGKGDLAWTPDDVTRPLGVYGATKLRGEQALERAGGVYAILRTSWVFSAYGTNFVKTMRNLGRSGGEVRVVKDQIGGPTSAVDIAQALMTMARGFSTGRVRHKIYHFSGAPECSWAEFARDIFAQSGGRAVLTPVRSKDYPTAAPRPRNSRLDCTLFEADFGLPQPEWTTSLTYTLRGLGANT